MALFPPGASGPNGGYPGQSTGLPRAQTYPQGIQNPAMGQGGAGGSGVVKSQVNPQTKARQQQQAPQPPQTFMQAQGQGIPRPSPTGTTPPMPGQGGITGTNPYMGGSWQGVSQPPKPQQPPPGTGINQPGAYQGFNVPGTPAPGQTVQGQHGTSVKQPIYTGSLYPGVTGPSVLPQQQGQQVQMPQTGTAPGWQQYTPQVAQQQAMAPIQNNATNAGQVGAANALGGGVQSLLTGQVNNPNPYANSPYMGAAGNLAMGQAGNPNPYAGMLNPAVNLAQQQGQQINPYLNSGLVGGVSNVANGLMADPMSPFAQGGMANSTQQAIQGQLANPNPYNAQNVQQMFQVMQTPILEQQQQELAANQANMAQRGLSTSGINEGQINDINTSAGRQQLSMADTLAQQIAQGQLQGTNSAIGNAAGYEGQLANQWLSGLGLGTGTAAGLQGQLAGQWQQGSNSAIGNQANLQNQLFGQNFQGTNAAIGNLSGLQGQQFGQYEQGTNSALANALGYGNQMFGQQMQTAQFNQNQDQINNQLMMQLLGAS